MGRSDRFHETMERQIGNELTSSHQYIIHATYFDSINLPQLAGVFYQHSLEERNHAMRFVQYLLNRGVEFSIPTPNPDHIVESFRDPIQALAIAELREKEVTGQIETLMEMARDASDYMGEVFMHWFVKEQVEEEKLFGTLHLVAKHEGGDMHRVETFVHREVDGAHAPGAPDIAGGSAHSD